MYRLAIFASGSGSNAEAIIQYFKDHSDIEVSLIVSNRADAGVLDRAKRLNVESLVIRRKEFYDTEELLIQLKEKRIDFIVLAGFLWLVPKYLIGAFPEKIVNIHPALLPKYGGKGMYGHHVHKAVAAARESESGITIHYVDENYDEGSIIFQARTALEQNDQPDEIAKKVLALEHEYYPRVIEEILLKY